MIGTLFNSCCKSIAYESETVTQLNSGIICYHMNNIFPKFQTLKFFHQDFIHACAIVNSACFSFMIPKCQHSPSTLSIKLPPWIFYLNSLYNIKDTPLSFWYVIKQVWEEMNTEFFRDFLQYRFSQFRNRTLR